jgi:hypothetical protein
MHFTHMRNLPGIAAAGHLHADSLVDRSSALRVEAADLDIKANRKQHQVTVAPFGCVADYVPFYFAPRSPMLYKLAKGSVPTYTEGQDPLVYLVSTVETVAATGVAWLFSDGNCASSVTQFFDDLTLLDSVVDWKVMRARMWNNTADDPDRMRRRMAEFLVHERVSTTCLAGIAVRTTIIEQEVESILTSFNVNLPVRVRADWYYD